MKDFFLSLSLLLLKGLNQDSNIFDMDPKMKPSISVIAPVYRAEKTLERAIKSLLSQTFQDFEVLFAFDGGEESLSILEKYEKEHPNFLIRRHSYRMGAGKGRLEAIKHAKGEYLAFLDSDDYFLPSCLETLYRAAKKEKADVVGASFFVLRKEGSKPSKNLFEKKVVLTDERSILKAFFNDTFFRSFLWNKLIKRSLIDNNPFLSFSEKGDLFEDKALLGSLLIHARKVVSIKDPVYVYNKTNGESLTSSSRKDRHSHAIDVYSALIGLFRFLKDEIALESFYSSLFRVRLSLSYDFFCDKKNGASKEYLRKEKMKQKSLFEKGSEEMLSSFSKRLVRLDDID